MPLKFLPHHHYTQHPLPPLLPMHSSLNPSATASLLPPSSGLLKGTEKGRDLGKGLHLTHPLDVTERQRPYFEL